jgi:hypothetical protein
MRVLSAAIAGFVIQAMGLGAFVAIADSTWALPGKQAVIVITFLLMAALLFFANRPYVFKRSVAVSILLALGYLGAYHLLGAIFFPGLFKDLQIPSVEHFWAILPIFGLLFVLYLAGSALVGLCYKFLSRPHATYSS